VCESGTRLLLSRKAHDAFVEEMVARSASLKVGDPKDPATTVGPLVSEKQLKRVLRYIDVGRAEGARVVLGGSRATEGALAKGFYVNPTIFVDVLPTHTIAQEEIFGPVLAVMKYGDTDEAVRIANSTMYGLAAGVWSQDLAAARSVAARLRAGWVWINEWHVLTPMAPFGGYKQSGIGREFGEEGLNEYTELKTLYQDDVRTREGRFWYDVVVPRTKSDAAT
jgi:aldehyde dehydrogenase (NAD+)